MTMRDFMSNEDYRSSEHDSNISYWILFEKASKGRLDLLGLDLKE